MKRKYITVLKKLCATTTAICFAFTVVSNNLFAAVNSDIVQPKKQYFELKGTNDLDCLFSDKYGKVVSYNNNFSDTVVINIQDLHCDYFVQKNVYFLIDEISKKYNIDNVYVEGGIDKIDISLFANIDSQYKQEILEKLLKSGTLTGTEYYSAINSKTNLLKGVEDKETYDRNIQRLSKILNSKKETEQILANISREIDFLKSKYLKSKNKSFDQLLKQFENQEISQDKFIIELFNYAKRNNISLKNYQNLQIYSGLFDYSINNKKVQKELVDLLATIKKILSYNEYNQLAKLTSNFTDIQKLGIFVKEICSDNNIDLSKQYPNVNKLFALKEQSLKYNPIELVKEERKLIDVLRTFLSETEMELEISYISDFEQLYKGYLTASLTATQWEYVKLGLDKFKELYAKYSVSNDIEKLEKYSQLLTDFYDKNTERNRIFVQKMGLSNRSASDSAIIQSSNLLFSAKKIVILVAGGYHTDGINEILNEKSISNITITPNIANSTKESRIKYEYLAQRQAMSVRQMIALGLISNDTPKEQVLTVINSLMPNKSLDGVDINILVQQLNQIFAQNITFSLVEDGKKLRVVSKDNVFDEEIILVPNLLFDSGLQNAANAVYTDEKGKLQTVLKVSDILSAIDLAAENGMNEMAVAWDDIIVGGKQGRSFSTDEELKTWMRLISEELKKYGPAIAEKAKEKNITLSFHAMTFERKFEGSDITFLPSPNIAGWKDVYKFQIEIAKQLGGSSIVVHAINDENSVDDWVELINIAMQNGIVINFENDMQYLQPQPNLYNKSLANGFIGKEDFITFLNKINEQLSSEAKEYMGVCIDTARVFNAISSIQNVSEQERQEQINFYNLINYIDYVIDAGYKINIVHLSQFDKSSMRKVIVGEEEYNIFYNKSNISNRGVISATNLQTLLKTLREHNPNIVVLQETGTYVTSKKDIKTDTKKTNIIDIDMDEEVVPVIGDTTSIPDKGFVQVTGELLDDIIANIKNTTFNYGEGVFVPQIYQISKDVCLFMVKNNKGHFNWYLGNGAVWEIANSEYSGKTLDGVEPVVYEYMPDFMQKALGSRQATVDSIKKKKSSHKIFARILALFMIIATIFNMTGCNIIKREPSSVEPPQYSVTEIADYKENIRNTMAVFQSDKGFFAYLTNFMSQADKDEWSSREFYYVDGLINTFDQANAAIMFLKMDDTEKAEEVLTNIVRYNCKGYEITRVSGRKETLYIVYKSNKESSEILGEIVWVGLAAVQYKLATGSDDFDDIIKTVDEYLDTRECVDGAGYYMGSSVMYFTSGGYSSSEHQLDIMAYFTLKSMLPDEEWEGIIPEHIVAKVLPDNTALKNATKDQLSEMVELSQEENTLLLYNACRALYRNLYKRSGIVRGYNDLFLVLDPNSWGIQVLKLVKDYAPNIEVEEDGVVVEKSIYEASELSKIDLDFLLTCIENTFYVTDEELRANLSDEDYQKYKGYHLYTWSREKFVDGKLNWSFEWSMQVAAAYYLMGNYEQAQLIFDDAQRFAQETGLYNGLLPASNVNGVKNYSDYGWKIPRAPSFAATITSMMLKYGIMNNDPSLSSPFFPVTYTTDIEDIDKNVPSSILPGTIGKINELISDGEFSVKKSLKVIINNESLTSFFKPLEFISSHINPNGARFLAILTAITFFLIFGLSMVLLYGSYAFLWQALLSISAAIFAAFDVNVGTHSIMDYRYLKSVGLAEAIKLYGKENVTMDEKGRVIINNKEQHIPVYVINDKPKNAEEFSFKSVPVKIKTDKGKSVKCWIGNYEGATVIFADGAKYEDIVNEFSKTRQFETIYSKKTALRANVDVIEVDMNNPDSGLRYSQKGNPIVGANILKTADRIDLQKEISLLNNKATETVTINQNIAIYIDDVVGTVSSSQEFMDIINSYVNSNDLGVNAKILFNDKFFIGDKDNDKKGFFELLEQEYGSAEAAKKEFIRIIEQLKQENKEIVVIFDETAETTDLNKYKQYGIFSYIANNEYVDGLTQNKSQAKFVTNLNQIYGFDGSLSIIKVSAFKEELAKSSGIFTLLTSSLNFKEYIKTRNINFVKQVANNFDFDQIPVIDIKQIAQILSDSENKFEALSKYLSGSDSITMYYQGLSDDEQRAAFMEEILKRALVVNYLRSLEKDKAYYGLTDKNLENILAKALVEKYRLQKTFEINSNETLDGANAVEVEFKLLQKISELSQQAFEKEAKTEQEKENKIKTLDDIINLIPTYAERNVQLRTANVKVMGIQDIKGILSAA